MLYEQVVGAAAVVVGAVLLAAGLPKVLRPGVFAAQIADYGIVRQRLTGFLARLISCSELAAGVMLLAGLFAPPWLRQAGAALATTLFVLFLAALGSAYTRGRSIACACFGGSSTELETVGAHSIVRTASLLVLAAIAVVPASRGRSFDIAGLAAILAALVALVSEMARLLGPLRQETAAILGEFTASSSPGPHLTALSRPDPPATALPWPEPRPAGRS